MTNELNESQKSAILSKIPVGDLGTSSDIATAALFLASDETSYITGQTLHVNGGMTMI
jgi:3-oxoacyl-[acyl-carrier protein] reductase